MAGKFNPLPQIGDIVWCVFPEIIGTPGPKPRPALVAAVSTDGHAVEVVYGTSKKTDKIYPTEFVMDPADQGFKYGGLSLRTKFDIAHRVKLSFDDQWFGVAPGPVISIPAPKLGVLHPSYIPALQRAAKEAARRITSD